MRELIHELIGELMLELIGELVRELAVSRVGIERSIIVNPNA